MARKSHKTSTATVQILDRSTTFTLRDICEHCGVHAEFVVELVEYGIITPRKSGPQTNWEFEAASLARLQRAQRLQRDLKINLPGLAMSLDLLDDVDRLQARVDTLTRQLEQLLDD